MVSIDHLLPELLEIIFFFLGWAALYCKRCITCSFNSVI